MQKRKYTATARVLHWTMALLLLPTIPAGFIMVQEGVDRDIQNALFLYHKNVGVLLLILVLARVGWRIANPAPPLPDTVPAWQARIARLTHSALYALMVILPVAGYIRVRAGGFPIESLDALNVPPLIPRSEALAQIAMTVHLFAAYAIAGVLAAHIGAALFHGIVKRDGVFSRIWPPVGGSTR